MWSRWRCYCSQKQLWGWIHHVYPACQCGPTHSFRKHRYSQNFSWTVCDIHECTVNNALNLEDVFCHYPLTSAGIFPLFSSTRGSVHLRPTSTRLKCSTGLPSLVLRVGRTTQTLGRVPCPKMSNSSTLFLIVGVILSPAGGRKQGGRSQQQKHKKKKSGANILFL